MIASAAISSIQKMTRRPIRFIGPSLACGAPKRCVHAVGSQPPPRRTALIDPKETALTRGSLSRLGGAGMHSAQFTKIHRPIRDDEGRRFTPAGFALLNRLFSALLQLLFSKEIETWRQVL